MMADKSGPPSHQDFFQTASTHEILPWHVVDLKNGFDHVYNKLSTKATSVNILKAEREKALSSGG